MNIDKLKKNFKGKITFKCEHGIEVYTNEYVHWLEKQLDSYINVYTQHDYRIFYRSRKSVAILMFVVRAENEKDAKEKFYDHIEHLNLTKNDVEITNIYKIY